MIPLNLEDKGGPKDVDGFGEAEKKNLMLYMQVEFIDKLEDHVNDCVRNWDNIHNFGSVLHMRQTKEVL